VGQDGLEGRCRAGLGGWAGQGKLGHYSKSDHVTQIVSERRLEEEVDRRSGLGQRKQSA
jgi:hypothetical protein